MSFDPHALIERLRGSRDWRADTRDLAETIRADPQAAVSLAAALDAELALGRDLAMESVRGSLVAVLGGSPDPTATRAAITIALRGPGRRELYALEIVGTRPAEEIWEALAADACGADPELGLLLVHDLIVRGAAEHPVAERYTSWAREARHELAILPPHLLPVERNLPALLPTWARYRGTAPHPVAEDGPRHELREVLPGIGEPVALDLARIGSPFRQYEGDQSFAAFSHGDGFPSGITEPELRGDVTCWQVTPEDLCLRFFGAAAGGPTYQGGAWSRCRMWEAVSAVVGHPWPSSVEALDDALRATRVYRLEPDDPWFDEGTSGSWHVVDAGGAVVVVAVVSFAGM